MFALTAKQLDLAAADLRAGVWSWRLGQFLAWQDIKQRYRRSTLGPIWLTLSFGVQIFTMGFLSAALFGGTISKSVPYVCAGMLFWALITQIINDGSVLFVSSSRYLTQIKSPLSLFLMQVIWRNVIIAAHNAAIYILIGALFVVLPSASILLWLPGFVLLLICLSWMAMVAAILSARYRDIPVMIQNLLMLLFWVTPLMYFPDQLHRHRYIVDYNPFTHMIAIVRDPLLGGVPTLNDWLVVSAIAVFGWILTFFFFARFRARVVYWL